ncbi:adenylate/guanylate cyclase domain-containing protein [uncultured Ruegeria sp.]|uniref:adenylate/guanylate cyclase domain-containing protein n=1 Tax=uncultured Ruegeria sp. TaxID=259304 RepID=UPI0026163033|nr:adenylate/guanylate cyclase domain-containing protein [uncultured Ruegeria sp.]
MNQPIHPSPELIAVVRRWNDAVRKRDGAALSNMLSTSEHVRYQGSADGEFWSGSLFRKGFPDHVAEIPNYDWQEHSLEAFECGPVGWAHCVATLRFSSNQKAMAHRFSFILHLEDGVWKMVHCHVSNPIANMEKIGIEHKALDALIAAARDGFRQDQREGMASVMFTDIVNSSAIAEKLGDRVWTEAIQKHFELARETIEAQGGTLVKSLGDGTMSSFSSARAALMAAAELQRRNAANPDEPSVQIRIGIHTGDVIQTDDDFFGTVVNKAARVAAAAAPDEVYVSDATQLLVGGQDTLNFGPPVSMELKGLPGDHTVYSLKW